MTERTYKKDLEVITVVSIRLKLDVIFLVYTNVLFMNIHELQKFIRLQYNFASKNILTDLLELCL